MRNHPRSAVTSRRGRPRTFFAAATLLVLGVAGCADSGEPHGAATPTQSSSPRPISVTVANKANAKKSPNVSFGGPVKLRTDHGELRSLTVTDEDGDTISGALAKDASTWKSAGPIGPDATWKWTAVGTNGTKSTGHVSSTKPTSTGHATVNIGRDQTVGVAAPIIVNFDEQVADKAALERHMTVRTRPEGSDKKWRPAHGSWAWMLAKPGTSKAHYRPKEFWPAHTDVRVDLPVGTRDWGGGVTGTQDITMRFTIGRKQVVKADAGKHNIVVYRNGKKVHTYPASYGKDSVTDRNTRSGIHVVTEKWKVKRMTSERWGYDLNERWAVRINNNGEFIHANPATVENQGSTNVSHGCINLSTADAKAYFHSAIYGDPVIVTGTKTKLSESLTELYDWALNWKKWKSLSALN